MSTIKISFYLLIGFSFLTIACVSGSSTGSAAENQTAATASKEVAVNAEVAAKQIAAAAKKDNSTHFKGTIDRNSVELSLLRASGELRGTYFYVKSGSDNRLNLTGKIDADGKFEMRETDQNGKLTGIFSGVWRENSDSPGATLEGDWRKPGAKEKSSFYAVEQMISFAGNVQIKTQKINETNKVKRFSVSVEYPEFSGGGINFAKLNQIVKNLVTKSVADFRKDAMSVTAEDLKGVPGDLNSDFDISYDVVAADENLISLLFKNYQYNAGAAHGNSFTRTINYDLKADRELKLADLFKPGADYLKPISEIVIKDLQSRKMPDSDENMGLAQDIFADGAKPTEENYSAWNITKKGLMFTFDPYQVGPYAAGPQTVVIPIAKLREIINPNSAPAKNAK
jgi:hypothetical protein